MIFIKFVPLTRLFRGVKRKKGFRGLREPNLKNGFVVNYTYFIWLTQKQMEELFDVAHATISEHISNILSSGELDETSVGFSDKSTGG